MCTSQSEALGPHFAVPASPGRASEHETGDSPSPAGADEEPQLAQWSSATLLAMSARPWFLWDVDVDEETLRARLHHPDPAIRAQWQGAVLREARFDEVFHYLSLDEILRDYARIERHLGRRRRFWQWLIDGWRRDGLLPAS